MSIKTVSASLTTFILKYHHIARGVLFIALGLLIALTAYYVEQHVILFGSIGFGIFAAYEGMIHVLSNPIKTDIALDIAKAKHWAESELGYDPTGVINPPAATPLAPVTNISPAPTIAPKTKKS